MMAKAKEKGLREYKAEIKALEEKLKTLDKNTGEYSRTKSRIDVLKNVVKRFKTPAREALLAGAKDAGVVGEQATEAPKVGRNKKGRVSRVRIESIVRKDGSVNMEQARNARNMNIITKGEYDEFKKLAARRNTVARAGGEVVTDSRPAVSVEGDSKRLVKQVEKPKDKPKTSTKSNPPKNKPSGRTRSAASYRIVRNGVVNIAAAKRAYDDGIISKSEFGEYKDRAMRQNRSGGGAGGAKKPGTDLVRRPSSEVVPKTRGAVELPSAKEVVNFAKNAGSKAAFLSKFGKVLGNASNAAMVYSVITNPDFGASDIDAWAKRNPNATISEKFMTSVRNAAGMDLKDSAALTKAKAAAKKVAAQKVAQGARARIAAGTSRVQTPADRGDRARGATSAAANVKAGRVTTSTFKGSQNGSMDRPGASRGTYTVKRGDNLWEIAQANKTTVSALLKVNPVIAQRRKAGKVDIYSGSKVRIPGKK